MPFSASSLESSEFDPPRFVIDEMVPEGITLLSGTPKLGKSWMALNMGIGVATGGIFLERDCHAGHVLYLALEDTPRRIQSRLKLCMGWDSFPSGLSFDCEWPRFPVGSRELDAYCVKHRPSLVLIDTLEMVRPPRRSNSYEDDYRALSTLRPLAAEHRCAFVVVHHNRKTNVTEDSTDDPLERVSGTLGLTGSVDNILVLSRLRGTQLGELYVMGRDIEEQRLTVRFDPAFGLWSLYMKEDGVRV